MFWRKSKSSPLDTICGFQGHVRSVRAYPLERVAICNTGAACEASVKARSDGVQHVRPSSLVVASLQYGDHPLRLEMGRSGFAFHVTFGKRPIFCRTPQSYGFVRSLNVRNATTMKPSATPK